MSGRRIKCYSVKVSELRPISPKAYLAVCFDGREIVIPRSQVFGLGGLSDRSESYWIAAWLVEKHRIQYSPKRVGWFNGVTVRKAAFRKVERIVPPRIEPVIVEADEELLR